MTAHLQLPWKPRRPGQCYGVQCRHTTCLVGLTHFERFIVGCVLFSSLITHRYEHYRSGNSLSQSSTSSSITEADLSLNSLGSTPTAQGEPPPKRTTDTDVRQEAQATTHTLMSEPLWKSPRPGSSLQPREVLEVFFF